MAKSKLDIEYMLMGHGRDFKAPDVAQKILNHHQVKDLVSLVFNEDSQLSNRAMWIVSHCNNIDSESIKSFYEILIEHLKKSNIHSGVQRGILSLFQKNEVPEKHQSFMLDKSLNFLKDPSAAIAVRTFSITVAFNIAKKFPELLEELVLLLNYLTTNEDTPALKARIKNTFKEIQKLKVKKRD